MIISLIKLMMFISFGLVMPKEVVVQSTKTVIAPLEVVASDLGPIVPSMPAKEEFKALEVCRVTDDLFNVIVATKSGEYVGIGSFDSIGGAAMFAYKTYVKYYK